VSNTLAAIAISHEAGIEWKVILSGLLKFKGVGRRLEKIFEKDDFIVIDDYGHHPTEVSATIKALKGVDHRKLTVVFEPHRFTRTQNFWKEFQECFTGADELYISPIYAASENPILGITSEKLVEEMKAKGINASFIFSLDEMKRLLEERKSRQGIFLTLGAGAISKKAREQVKSL
jgi:UDP-N-acetylmuramate--alanine ligase